MQDKIYFHKRNNFPHFKCRSRLKQRKTLKTIF